LLEKRGGGKEGDRNWYKEKGSFPNNPVYVASVCERLKRRRGEKRRERPTAVVWGKKAAEGGKEKKGERDPLPITAHSGRKGEKGGKKKRGGNTRQTVPETTKRCGKGKREEKKGRKRISVLLNFRITRVKGRKERKGSEGLVLLRRGQVDVV